MEKMYLGDGAYVELDPSGIIKLTTSDGYADTNTVFMEPEVLRAFELWVLQQRQKGNISV